MGAVLVANAEIYNDPELRVAMADQAFSTGSDCEVAPRLGARDGLDFAEQLRGMYAIALFDPATGRLVLARDPFGIKQLYYVETPESAFASEAQALIAAGLVGREDPHGRARRADAACKFTTGPETIFQGVRRVLPGVSDVLAGGKVASGDGEQRRRHGDFVGDVERGASSPPDEGLVRRSTICSMPCTASFRRDRPVLVALMARLTDQPVYAMTAGFFESGGADETALASRVAVRRLPSMRSSRSPRPTSGPSRRRSPRPWTIRPPTPPPYRPGCSPAPPSIA